MKKRFSIYGALWLICVAIFNIVVFVPPREIGGVDRFEGGAFWISYALIMVAFVGQLICALISLKAENVKKFFYKLPIISASYSCLVLMLIVGSVFMIIPALPEWIAIVLCFAALAVNGILVVKAVAASEIVSDIDENIQAQAYFIRSLTIEAQSLVSYAKNEVISVEIKRVYEAVRYSDPMGNVELAEIEKKIKKEFASFSEAVEMADEELASAHSQELLRLINLRNQKCRLLK